MLKKVFSTLVVVSMILSLVPMTIGAATVERFALNQDFENIAPAEGQSLAAASGLTESSVTGLSTAIVDDGSKVFKMTKNAALSGTYTLTKGTSSATPSHAFQYSFKFSNGSNGKILDSTWPNTFYMWYSGFSNPITGTLHSPVTLVNDSANGVSLIMPGSGQSWAYSNESANNKWYTLTYVVYEDDNGNLDLKSYLNGVKKCSLDANQSADTFKLTQFMIQMQNNFSVGSSYSVDDLRVINKLPTFTATGEFGEANKFPVKGGSFKLKFDSPVEVSTLSNMTISDGANTVAYTKTVSNDMMTVTVTPSTDLAYETNYAVNLAGVKDVFGVDVTSGATQSFKTQSVPRYSVFKGFDDLTETSGLALFSEAGFGHSGYSTDALLTGDTPQYVFEKVNENGNNVIKFYKNTATASAYLQPTYKNLGRAVNSVVQYKVKYTYPTDSSFSWMHPVGVNYYNSTTGSNVNKNIYELRSDNLGLRYLNEKTGSWATAKTGYSGTWNTVTYVAVQDANNKHHIEHYFNGKLLYETVPSDAVMGIDNVQFIYNKDLPQNFEYYLDDVSVMNKISTFKATGDFGTPNMFPMTGGSFKLVFDAPVNPATLSNITINGAGANVAYTTAVSDDMMTVTVTPSADLAPLTNYTVSLSGVTDVFDVAVTEGQSMGFKTGNIPQYVIEENFDDYNPSVAVLPNIFKIESGTLTATTDGTNQAIRVAGANGYTGDGAMMIKKLVAQSTSGASLNLFNNVSLAGAGASHSLQFRVKVNHDTDLYTNSSYVTDWLQLPNFKYSGTYLNTMALTGGGTTAAMRVRTPDGGNVNLGTVNPDKWYTFTFNSVTDDAGLHHYEIFVDGVLYGATEPKAETATLTDIWMPFNYTNKGVQLAIDDFRIYKSRTPEVVGTPAVTEGATNASVAYEITAPINAKSFTNAKFYDAQGQAVSGVNVTVNNADMTKFTVSAASALAPNATYTLKLDGATDAMGNELPVTTQQNVTTRTLVNGPSTGARKVFIVGDSTAAQYPNEKTNVGWGAALEKFLNDDITVVNKAVGGEWSKHYYETASLWGTVKNNLSEGDYVIIQLGHNDPGHNGSATLGKDVSTVVDGKYSFKYYIQQMITEAIAKGAVPIIASLTPIKKTDFVQEAGTISFSNALKELATDNSIAFVDVASLACARFATYDAATVEKIYCDNIHFEWYGAAEIAALFAEGLEDSYSNLAGYVKDLSDMFVFDSNGVLVTNDAAFKTYTDGVTVGAYTKLSDGGKFTARVYARGGAASTALVAGVFKTVNGKNAMTTAQCAPSEDLSSAKYAAHDLELNVPAGAETVKLFVWENLINLKPIAPAKTAK